LRKIIFTVFAAILTLTISATAFASNDVSVTIDGVPQSFDVPAQIIDGRTMVPMRAIFEALGASVEWNDETRSITATAPNGDITVLTIGVYSIIINGTGYDIAAPPMIIDGNTLVHVRVVAQGMNANVEWDEASRTVEIETPTLAESKEEFGQMIFELTNEVREQAGLPLLTWDEGLAEVARAHVQDMVESGLTSNTGSDGSTAVDRVQAAELDMVHISGNAFRVNAGYPEDVFAHLINNRQRENNILGELTEYGGVAVVLVPRDRGSDHMFVVQKFGTAAITDPLEFGDRLFELINVERVGEGLRSFQRDTNLTDAARANTRRRYEEEATRARARDLVFERSLTIRANELSPEFLMSSIQRHDSRGMLLDAELTRLGVGYIASHPSSEDSDGRVIVQLSLVFGTPTEIPEIADPFYIPNLIDAGYSAAEIAYMFEREVLRLINAARVANRRSPLSWDNNLARAARSHSQDLAENDIFGHIGSDGSSSLERVENSRARVYFISENISNRPMSPQAAVDRWLDSSRQRENIFCGDSTHIGIGFFHLPGSQHETYLTQILGRTQ